MLTDLDEGLQAVVVAEQQDVREVAFGESLCCRHLNALDFAGKTKSHEAFFVQIRALQIWETSSGGSEENEAGWSMIDTALMTLVLLDGA